MKSTILFATLSLLLASPVALAKSELEILRARCNEQEMQIKQLEKENALLKSGGRVETLGASKTTTISTTKKSEPAAESSGSIYVVKSGDNLVKIARNLGTSAQSLAKANGLTTSSIIHPDQKLKVPGGTTAAAATTKSASADPRAPDVAGKTHTVRDGETYYSISKKYRISAEALAAANPKVKPTALRTGQVLSLGAVSSSSIKTVSAPVSEPKTAAAAPEKKSSAPKPAADPPRKETVAAATPKPTPASTPSKPVPAPAAEKPAAPAADSKPRSVTIDTEMTYGEFAAKHGTDAARLNDLNGLDLTTATVLAKGSELYVPGRQ